MQTSTGNTVGFELPADLAASAAALADPGFQRGIRGLTLLRDGSAYALPLPRSFRRSAYSIEWAEAPDGRAVAVRASVVADDITATMTLYLGSPMVKFDMRRTGKLRWRPDERE